MSLFFTVFATWCLHFSCHVFLDIVSICHLIDFGSSNWYGNENMLSSGISSPCISLKREAFVPNPEVCLCKITFALRKVWWQLVGRRYAYNIIIVCAELTSAPLSVIINRDHKLITMEIWEHYRILHSVTHHILGWPQNNLFMKIFKVSKYLWGFV